MYIYTTLSDFIYKKYELISFEEWERSINKLSEEKKNDAEENKTGFVRIVHVKSIYLHQQVYYETYHVRNKVHL